MDPNETLRQLLESAREFARRGTLEAASNTAALALALDKWIRSGGFLPDAWIDGHDEIGDYKVREVKP